MVMMLITSQATSPQFSQTSCSGNNFSFLWGYHGPPKLSKCSGFWLVFCVPHFNDGFFQRKEEFLIFRILLEVKDL